LEKCFPKGGGLFNRQRFRKTRGVIVLSGCGDLPVFSDRLAGENFLFMKNANTPEQLRGVCKQEEERKK
jgi:hypothetical protein